MRKVRYGAALAAIAATALACGSGEAPEAAADGAVPSADGATAAAADLIPGTPPGGLEDWIAEVREGTGALPAQVASSAAEARQKAVDLYVGRQEYIEMYYGANGKLTQGEALGAAVTEAESRFHTLMQLLGETPAPDSARVAAAVAALSEQYDVVLEAARSAGVPMMPGSGAQAAGGAL